MLQANPGNRLTGPPTELLRLSWGPQRVVADEFLVGVGSGLVEEGDLVEQLLGGRHEVRGVGDGLLGFGGGGGFAGGVGFSSSLRRRRVVLKGRKPGPNWAWGCGGDGGVARDGGGPESL